MAEGGEELWDCGVRVEGEEVDAADWHCECCDMCYRNTGGYNEIWRCFELCSEMVGLKATPHSVIAEGQLCRSWALIGCDTSSMILYLVSG